MIKGLTEEESKNKGHNSLLISDFVIVSYGSYGKVITVTQYSDNPLKDN